MKLDHITAFVADADEGADVLRRLLGHEPVATVSLPGMAIRSFRIGEAEIHVNAPTGPGPVEDHMKRHGPGYHHFALRVEDLAAATADLAAKGFSVLGEPVETAPGVREIFLDPKTTRGLWIQLVERKAATGDHYELDGAAVANLAAQASER